MLQKSALGIGHVQLGSGVRRLRCFM